MKDSHTLIIDIGNSRTKFYFQGKEILALEELSKYSSLRAFVVTTVPKRTQAIIEALPCRFQEIIFFSSEKQSKISNLYSGIGMDRVIKLLGLSELCPNQNLALFDFGTATTLSLIDSHAVFLGGYIGLGYQASLQALAQNCENLEDCSSQASLNLVGFGHSRTEAIVKGSYQAHLGLIEQWKKQIITSFDERFVYVACGGQSHLFVEEFDCVYSDAQLLTQAYESMLKSSQ